MIGWWEGKDAGAGLETLENGCFGNREMKDSFRKVCKIPLVSEGRKRQGQRLKSRTGCGNSLGELMNRVAAGMEQRKPRDDLMHSCPDAREVNSGDFCQLLFVCLFVCLFVLVKVGIKPRTPHILDKHCTTAVSQALTIFFRILRCDLIKLSKLALN